MHRAPRLCTFGRPPPAHPVASRRREARAPRGRAPCSLQTQQHITTKYFLCLGIGICGRGRSKSHRRQSEFSERIRMRLLRGVLAWHTALASSRKSSLCVVFDLHATVTTKTPFLARIWLSELYHAFPRYPTEREKAGTNHPRVPTPPRCRWRALGD